MRRTRHFEFENMSVANDFIMSFSDIIDEYSVNTKYSWHVNDGSVIMDILLHDSGDIYKMRSRLMTKHPDRRFWYYIKAV